MLNQGYSLRNSGPLEKSLYFPAITASHKELFARFLQLEANSHKYSQSLEKAIYLS